MNQPQPVPPQGGQPMAPQGGTSKWLWIVLVIVILIAAGYFGWNWYSANKAKTSTTGTTTTPTTTKTTTKTTPSTTTTTETATTSGNLTYTNDKYGFTLTFPSTWTGYKMKEATLTDSVITYYINVPTTDKTAVAGSTSDAGYYSPFAITVYTLAQWTTVENAEGPKDTLITKNTQYAFGWNQANGTPPSDWTKGADIKTIIASFKLK